MTLIIGVFINELCFLVPYQGQGQRSTSRSLHSKFVKTFLVHTFHFHDLLVFLYFSSLRFVTNYFTDCPGWLWITSLFKQKKQKVWIKFLSRSIDNDSTDSLPSDCQTSEAFQGSPWMETHKSVGLIFSEWPVPKYHFYLFSTMRASF